MDREAHAREMLTLQDEIAERHQGTIRDAIEDAMIQVAAVLPFRQSPDLPPELMNRIKDALTDLYRDTTRTTAETMIGRFKAGFVHLETKEDFEEIYQRILEEYLQAHGSYKIVQITEATRRQIVALIRRGLKEGLSIDEIAKEIREQAPVIAEVRSAVITRTETHSSSMYASLQSARRSTIPLNKEWVSVEDGRTRDFGEADGEVDMFNHRKMDGVSVPLEQPFEVPNKWGFTEKLMYPGDPQGSAANVINCRCAQVYRPAN